MQPKSITADFPAKPDSAEARHHDAIQEDPKRALAVLEADQLVAAKQRTRFGPRNLSFRDKLLLWALRVYVVVMLALVVVSVLRSLR